MGAGAVEVTEEAQSINPQIQLFTGFEGTTE
jgi:hypothetical protein